MYCFLGCYTLKSENVKENFKKGGARVPEERKLRGMQVYLTEEEHKAFAKRRKAEGLTSTGALREAILAYIAGGNHGRTVTDA